MVLLQDPPKLVYDGSGTLVEVVLSADDFRSYLRALAEEQDWETLPPFLQDAVDSLLIDQVLDEKADAVDFERILAENSGSWRIALRLRGPSRGTGLAWTPASDSASTP